MLTRTLPNGLIVTMARPERGRGVAVTAEATVQTPEGLVLSRGPVVWRDRDAGVGASGMVSETRPPPIVALAIQTALIELRAAWAKTFTLEAAAHANAVRNGLILHGLVADRARIQSKISQMTAGSPWLAAVIDVIPLDQVARVASLAPGESVVIGDLVISRPHTNA